MSWTPEQEKARQELIKLVDDWRTAECSGRPGFGMVESQLCDGDNHQMECPVERARQDVIAAHNRVLRLVAL